MLTYGGLLTSPVSFSEMVEAFLFSASFGDIFVNCNQKYKIHVLLWRKNHYLPWSSNDTDNQWTSPLKKFIVEIWIISYVNNFQNDYPVLTTKHRGCQCQTCQVSCIWVRFLPLFHNFFCPLWPNMASLMIKLSSHSNSPPPQWSTDLMSMLSYRAYRVYSQ